MKNKTISLDRGLAVELYYALQVAIEGKVVCGKNSSIAGDLKEVMEKLNKVWKIENGMD